MLAYLANLPSVSPDVGPVTKGLPSKTDVAQYEFQLVWKHQEARAWQEALSVLISLKRRSIKVEQTSINAAIKCCGMVGEWEQSLALLHDTHQPSADGYAEVVRATAQAQAWEWSLQLLQHARRWGTIAETDMYNNVIVACARGRQFRLAQRVFREILEHGLQRTPETYNAMVVALGAEGLWEESLALLRSLIQPDRRAYQGTMKACAMKEKFALCSQLMSEMWDVILVPDEYSYHSLITACGRISAWKHALYWLEDMHFLMGPRTITSTAAMHACTHARQWSCALGLLRDLKKSEEELDAAAYHAALQACGFSLFWQAAVQLLDETVRQALEPTALSFNLAAQSCARAEQWEATLQLFYSMQEALVEADAWSFIAVVSAFDKVRMWEWSVLLLQQMMRQSVDSLVAHVTVMGTCMRSLEWCRVLWLLAQLTEPDIVAYNSAITACERCMEWERSLLLLLEADRRSVTPDMISYSAVISACENGGHWRGALELLDTIDREELEVSSKAYDATVSACEKGSHWAYALLLLALAEKRQLQSDHVSYHAALLACERARDWVLSLQLLSDMATRHIAPDAAALEVVLAMCEEGQALGSVPPVMARLNTGWPELTGNGGANAVRSAILAVELSESHGQLGAALAGALRRGAFASVLTALRGLQGKGGGGTADMLLEQQPGLPFTSEALTSLGMAPLGRVRRRRKHRRAKGAARYRRPEHWPLTASLASRREAREENAPRPSAKLIAAWSSFRVELEDSGGQLDCGGRCSGHGAVENCVWLPPVLVQHDRSQHAERSALAAFLEQLHEVPRGGCFRLYTTAPPCVSCVAMCCHMRRLEPKLRLKLSFAPWWESRRWMGQ